MGKAIFDVSCEVLRDLLYLPADAEVVMALLPAYPHSVRLIVEAPQFDDTKQGASLPVVSPSFERVESPSTVTMINWGFPLAGNFA